MDGLLGLPKHNDITAVKSPNGTEGWLSRSVRSSNLMLVTFGLTNASQFAVGAHTLEFAKFLIITLNLIFDITVSISNEYMGGWIFRSVNKCCGQDAHQWERWRSDSSDTITNGYEVNGFVNIIMILLLL